MDVINAVSGTSKTVAYTAAAGTTAEFNGGATGVLVLCTTAAYVRINGAATTSDIPVGAGIPMIIRLTTQNPFTVSAIRLAADGSLIAQPIIGSTI